MQQLSTVAPKYWEQQAALTSLDLGLLSLVSKYFIVYKMLDLWYFVIAAHID